MQPGMTVPASMTVPAGVIQMPGQTVAMPAPPPGMAVAPSFAKSSSLSQGQAAEATMSKAPMQTPPMPPPMQATSSTAVPASGAAEAQPNDTDKGWARSGEEQKW